MAEKWKAALAADMKANAGKSVDEMTSSIAMFGSGQWTVFEGYAASKLWKAGFRSNNLDPNARHCMASAVAGFMRTFGIDEPMGCYDDIENADAFVLWGSNMAEMHPILWSRLTDRRLTHKGSEVHVLSTFEHRSFELADNGMIFTPQTDLAILNYIANYIIQNKAVNLEFVKKHVNFKKVPTTSASGCARPMPAKRPPRTPTRSARPMRSPSRNTPSSFPNTRSRRSPALRRARRAPRAPRQGVCRPEHQGGVLLDHGFQPAHARHLGEQHVLQHPPADRQDLDAGSGPFSLTGQPSACGTAREVGTFAHRLPADLVVNNPEHRKHSEELWKLPEGTLNGKIGFHAVLQSRMLKDGKISCYWTSTTNNMQAGPNINDELYPGWRNEKAFVVVSDCYRPSPPCRPT